MATIEAAGLMAGAGPTATRAMALNFGMLAFNASAKVWEIFVLRGESC